VLSHLLNGGGKIEICGRPNFVVARDFMRRFATPYSATVWPGAILRNADIVGRHANADATPASDHNCLNVIYPNHDFVLDGHSGVSLPGIVIVGCIFSLAIIAASVS